MFKSEVYHYVWQCESLIIFIYFSLYMPYLTNSLARSYISATHEKERSLHAGALHTSIRQFVEVNICFFISCTKREIKRSIQRFWGCVRVYVRKYVCGSRFYTCLCEYAWEALFLFFFLSLSLPLSLMFCIL